MLPVVHWLSTPRTNHVDTRRGFDDTYRLETKQTKEMQSKNERMAVTSPRGKLQGGRRLVTGVDNNSPN